MSLPFAKILIVLPWYSEHDAISNDAAWQARLLKGKGFDAFLYAEGSSPKLASEMISIEEMKHLAAEPRTLLIYHHGVYWILGAQILKEARCVTVMKYHNITPPEFYRPYDRIATFATEAGRTQTGDFLEKKQFHAIICDSYYNLNDLRTYGFELPQSFVVPPFTQLSDFDRITSDEAIKTKLEQNGRLNLLFVGRIVPNKGILSIIEVMRKYIRFYGAAIEINIIGGLGLSEETYFREIEDKINSYQLDQHIHFLKKVEFAQIKAYFEYSAAFLLMSEHEGFCVPILESQYLGLPILALGLAAVPETIGENQLVLDDKNPAAFAVALHRLKTDKTLRQQCIEAGYKNYQRFEPEVLLTDLITIFETLV